MKNKWINISFTGIDGSGKTTQASFLTSWLRKQGLNVIQFESPRNLVSEIGFALAKNNGYHSASDFLGEDNYLISMAFELIRQNLINIKPYNELNASIVSSRTCFDWLAGSYARGASRLALELAEKIVVSACLPSIIIWLKVDVEVAFKRIKTRGYDYNDFEYLVKFNEYLELLSEKYNFLRINGDNGVPKIHQEIINCLTF
jgi:dTMP kinase